MNDSPAPGEGTSPAEPHDPFDTDPDEAATGFPWPPRAGESFLDAWARSWHGSVFHPSSFFRRMPADQPIGPVLPYLITVAVAAAGIQLFWDMVWLGAGLVTGQRGSLWPFATAASPASALLSFFFAPLLVLVVLFVGGGITHVILTVLGAGSRGFAATLRVCAFGQGPQLFVIVPGLGWLIAVVWSIAITIIGLREVHAAPGWKPAIAVLAPLGCLLAVLVLIAIVLAVGSVVLPGV